MRQASYSALCPSEALSVASCCGSLCSWLQFHSRLGQLHVLLLLLLLQRALLLLLWVLLLQAKTKPLMFP